MKHKDTLRICLQDMGDSFLMYDDDRIIPKDLPIEDASRAKDYVTIPYGVLSTSLIYLYPTISDFITDSSFGRSLTDESFLEKARNRVNESLKESSLTGYVLKELIIRDMANIFETDDDDFSSHIYNRKKFMENISPIVDEVIKDRSNNLKMINESFYDSIGNTKRRPVETSVSFDDGIMSISYHPNDLYDLLMIDLNKYITRSIHMIKYCECCQHLFVPTRTNDKYCQVPDRIAANRTCGEVMKLKPQDEFAKLRNQARDNQHKFLTSQKNKGLLTSEEAKHQYAIWSEQCAQRMSEFKKQDNLAAFKDWIIEHKNKLL